MYLNIYFSVVEPQGLNFYRHVSQPGLFLRKKKR